MALAAYNAGPSRVYKWVEEFGDPRDPRVNLVNWIEMIPIYETRNYVQRVLEGVYVYRQILSRNKGKQDGGVTHLALQ
jgi:soluble lytic murein transglycosylase